MKTISFKDFEQHFDDFIEDVIENGRHYKIELDDGKAVMLIPAEDYTFLVNTYEEWVNSTKETID